MKMEENTLVSSISFKQTEIKIFDIFLDTDVNEFLVRHMSSLFHPQDIELLQASYKN